MAFLCKVLGCKNGQVYKAGHNLRTVYCDRCGKYLDTFKVTVDDGNEADTLGVSIPTQGVSAMTNTGNATWVLGNTSPATVASVYYSPGQASTQRWSILPNSGIMSAQPTIMMPYDPFMTDQTGITLIPEPNFTDEQIEEALEYING